MKPLDTTFPNQPPRDIRIRIWKTGEKRGENTGDMGRGQTEKREEEKEREEGERKDNEGKDNEGKTGKNCEEKE